eukprot:INCI9952.5.p1 GENE.INCI9952.5~~INCI9952.5.p1  ORF type:complete len:406 (-),score=54.60 INCI9952.5:29-1246(-)
MDQFNGSPNMFLMLISTKAGGLGLNLTSANVVIQFNPTWNPAHDVQAQDRAFRIGQRRHVTVYRLISMGTVDELMYMRQINKITVGNHTLTGASATRLYEGVSGETHGDLFGIENIFRYSRSGFEQSHLVHRRSERRKYFRLVDRGTVQSERSASHKQQSAISQPTSKALLTRPQIDDVVSQLEHIYMDVAPEKLRQLPNIRTKLKTGALSFEFLAKQVAELPDPTDGSPPHVLRLQLQSCNPPAGSALKPESAMAPEVFTWRRDDDTLSFESEGGFVVDGDMFHQNEDEGTEASQTQESDPTSLVSFGHRGSTTAPAPFRAPESVKEHKKSQAVTSSTNHSNKAMPARGPKSSKKHRPGNGSRPKPQSRPESQPVAIPKRSIVKKPDTLQKSKLWQLMQARLHK